MINKLIELIGEKKVLTGEMIGADFCHDEFPGPHHTPDAVVEAASTEDVAAVLKLCNEMNVPVTVRGAGTGQAGGSVPVKGGIILSVKGMNQILEFNESENTLRVQPGVLLQEVKATAESHGMYYPPDPGELTATIGGNAATNASGPCAIKYGTTRDYIADAVLVKADGSVVPLAGNEAALGSEGTLAVITELTLKLIDPVKADAILLFPFMDTETCLNAANTFIGSDYAPSVLEYIDTDIVEFSGKVTGNPVFPVEMDGERVGATLMMTIEGEDDDDVMEKMEAIAEMAEELECLDILVGDTASMKREFWAAHGAFHTSMESGANCTAEVNITVPTKHIGEMLEFAKETAAAKGLQALMHAHVGSGGMHIHVVSDGTKEEFAPLFAQFASEAYAKCAELGGNIAGEYGIGYGKLDAFKTACADDYAVRTTTKAIYDPKGILNSGKVAELC